MRTNTSEVLKHVENTKNRTQTGHTLLVSGFETSPLPPPPSPPKTRDERDNTLVAFPVPPLDTGKGRDRTDKTPRAGRDSVAYWKAKVRPRVIRGTPTPELYARLFEGGRESWICLDTSNRATAAERARGYYLRMKAIGLPALLAELRPDARPDRVCTVGEYLDAARTLSQVKPRVFVQYERALRRLVAAVFDLPSPPERFYHKGEAVVKWRAKIDAVSLERLSPATVEAWRVAFINSAHDEIKRKARAVTVASYIRNAKGAFARKIVAGVATSAEGRPALVLPPVLPFAGVTAAATTRRFKPQNTASALYEAALHDLKRTPDTLTAFMLLICGGLRRGEADLLPWAHVDLEGGKITVAATPYFTPKTEEGERVVKLPPPVVSFLRDLRKDEPAASFVLHGGAPKSQARGVFYRAHAWAPLTAWLRGQKVTARCPLHELRKHSGSLVYAAGGIEAARRHLGHRKVTTTSASYLDAAEVVADPTAKQ